MLSSREVEVFRGITTGWTRFAFTRSLTISKGTVNTYLNTLHLQRLHPHHFPRSVK
jgi:DNA-binding NarL/FixJ family response regulator